MAPREGRMRVVRIPSPAPRYISYTSYEGFVASGADGSLRSISPNTPRKLEEVPGAMVLRKD